MKLPTVDVLIDLHDESLDVYGGAPGIRDRGALQIVMNQAEELLSTSEDTHDAIEIASFVCVNLCRKHAFIDGNKRIAFIALGIILELNGFYLDARETEAVNIIWLLAGNGVSEIEFRAWVRSNTISSRAC